MLEHLTWAVALVMLTAAQDKHTTLENLFVVGATVLAIIHFFAAFLTLL